MPVRAWVRILLVALIIAVSLLYFGPGFLWWWIEENQ